MVVQISPTRSRSGEPMRERSLAISGFGQNDDNETCITGTCTFVDTCVPSELTLLQVLLLIMFSV